ncbi:dolichol phosphate-mannose biosynthesis regulatory protein-like isoform X2 [Patiria miniata]|uniref:Dolichol phosphate-mannose biosynthesis regulatory protein n=2 Tax=Patiria miniata TaxID=46514 RepID=A0A914AKJ3_PATMI|nr:dolichol phosphate-mannose biosynthesis regulatory protein-like isoform X2 [Patiria miniata]
MATSMDQALGMGLVAFAGAIFSYYTIWVIFMPFVDDDHFLQQFFLPRFYAIALPVVAGLIFLTFIGVFVTAVTLAKKKKSK